jgi:hypothetical protein
MATLLPEGKQSFTTNGSLPLAGGKVYTYEPGTSTPKDTYTTSAASVANANPVILDSRGEATIFWSGAYDVILKTSADVTIWGPIRHETPEISGSAAAVLTDLASTSDAAKGDALIGVKRTGTGAVAMTGHSFNDTMPVSVVHFGGVMDSSGSSVRTANSAALLLAAGASKRVNIPAGVFWIDPNIEVPADLELYGAGRDITTIKGDGDLFKLTATASIGVPYFHDLAIANDVTRGKLFKTAIGSDIGRVQFERVEFGKSTYHIHSTDICVDWLIYACRFNDASINSRAFTKGIWAHNEFGCYTWFNGAGLVVNGSSETCHINGVFEFNTNDGISITADDAGKEIGNWDICCHFEGNGSSGAADITLTTSAATRIRSINLHSTFINPDASQTLHLALSAGGGGNIDRINYLSGACYGATQFCADTTSVRISPDVYFATVAPRATNAYGLEVQYQFSSFLGAVTVTGSSGGNGVVQASVTPPTGTKWADVKVQGNSYNGAANTHDGRLYGTYRSSGNRVSTDVDVNNAAGANQGWVLTWTGSAIQIANKAGMTNAQSGDTTMVFYS